MYNHGSGYGFYDYNNINAYDESFDQSFWKSDQADSYYHTEAYSGQSAQPEELYWYNSEQVNSAYDPFNEAYTSGYPGRNRSHHELFHDHNNSVPRNRPHYSHRNRRDHHLEKNPVPSSSYLQLAEQPSVRLADPTQMRKLLILDLNGTLLYREPLPLTKDGKDPYTLDEPRPLRVAHPRPYMPSLKAFLFHPKTRKWLDTMVWSSAQYPNVKDMVGRCFGEDQVAEYDGGQREITFQKTEGERKGLVAIWDRNFVGLSPAQFKNKTQTTKNLDKPWALLPLSTFSGPARVLSEAWDRVTAENINPSTHTDSQPHNASFLNSLIEQCQPARNDLLAHSALSTLLLDDSPLKARMQPYNHLCVPEYDETYFTRDVRICEAQVRDIDVEDPALPESNTEPSPVNESPSLADEGAGIGKRKRSRSSSAQNLAKKIKNIPDEDKVILSKHHDHILLAVIGILDALRCESNVAAWVKNEGLYKTELKFDDVDLGVQCGDSEVAEEDKELDALYLKSVPDGVDGVTRSPKKKERWSRKRRLLRDSASLGSEQFSAKNNMAFSDSAEDLGHGNDTGITEDDLVPTIDNSRPPSPDPHDVSQISVVTEPDSPVSSTSKFFANYSGTTTEPPSPPSAGRRRELARIGHLLPRQERRDFPPLPKLPLRSSRPSTPHFVSSSFLYGKDTASNKSSPIRTPNSDLQEQHTDLSSGEKDIFSGPSVSPPGLDGKVNLEALPTAAELAVEGLESSSSAEAQLPEKPEEVIVNRLPSLWYQDAATRLYWVRRGIFALKELGLEVISGFEAAN
ncbi:hypothetical protein BDP27DRAFT_1415746 [Rhodocollybia butyracea]|uniref:FCP1 homology domain-containing protein n=1 Tax=Rhodocollybia butyracea TaxID=206335 RepID=A0A9P5Q592_9AGAR|nr:hypothetical protein BDP27DRAFT_1415746 [Rhodocollybia butyracea]